MNPGTHTDIKSLSIESKKLVLYGAYLAYRYHDWKNGFFADPELDQSAKHRIIEKMPCADPLLYLLEIARYVVPDYDGQSPIKDNLARVENFFI